MKDQLVNWLEALGITLTPVTSLILALALILAISLLIHIVLHFGVIRTIARRTGQSPHAWQRALFNQQLFNRLALTLQGVIVYVQCQVWLEAGSTAQQVLEVIVQLWILLYGLLTIFSLLDTLLSVFQSSATKLPLRGIFQSLKLIGAIVTVILMIALLIGKSPLILFSGLGAMTAVLMLVFKDPLLGLVAGIQLSANNMLRVGDWLEMPKYGADGDVTDISLTTVKVRNWDNTITTVPSYALISDSFKNWRGMSDSGGRRIKRSIYIDATSVEFLSEDELERLRKAQLLSHYIEDKLNDIENDNRKNGIDPSSPVNGRRMTNLGTFRAYMSAYLRAHTGIHKDMIQMVRQLDPTSNGIPLEIYAFTSDTAWVAYEGIQADIFDHLFAVIPEFGLRVHQTPTGYDMRQLGVTDKGASSSP